MNDIWQDAPQDDRPASPMRPVRRQALATLGLSGLLVGIDWVFLAGTWVQWPIMLLLAALGIHYLYAKSRIVDDDWADNRVTLLRVKSYDIDHILKIEETYKQSLVGEDAKADPTERDGR